MEWKFVQIYIWVSGILKTSKQHIEQRNAMQHIEMLCKYWFLSFGTGDFDNDTESSIKIPMVEGLKVFLYFLECASTMKLLRRAWERGLRRSLSESHPSSGLLINARPCCKAKSVHSWDTAWSTGLFPSALPWFSPLPFYHFFPSPCWKSEKWAKTIRNKRRKRRGNW